MDDWDDSFDLATDLDFVSGLPSGSFSSEDRFREEEENENESFDSQDNSEEGVWGDEDAAAEERNREELDQEYHVGSAVKGVCSSFKSMSLGRPHPSTIGTQLGSRRKVPVALVEDDWDTEFQSPPTSLVRHVSSQSSFTSQISDHSEDHPLRQNYLMSTPDKKLASSQVIDDNNDFDDADFDLPDKLSRISLSPLLSRPSILLLSDYIHAPVATHLQPPTTAKLVSPLLTPYRSRSITSSPSASNDVDSDDDEEFWEGMILPSFFSGGPGALTPPTSDGETSMQSGRRVDLQAMLKQKLDQRNEMVEKARSRLPIRARVTSVKLDSYKERKEDKEVDVGLDVGELGAKLTNRINRPPSSLLPVRGRHRSQTTPTQQRRNITLALSRTPSAPDAFTPPSRRNPSMTNKIPVAPLPPSSASVAFKERAKSRIPRFNDQTPRPQRSIPRIETTLSTPPVALPPSPTLSPMAPVFSASVSSKVSHQRHQSNPTTPTSSSTRLFNGQRTPTTASRASNLAQPQTTSPIKGSTSRLMNPTAASLAKSRINSLEHSSSPGTFGVRAPMNLRRPKRARVYGDGTELDAFDDLDTSREKERIILRNTGSTLKGRGSTSDRNSTIRAGGSTIKASGTIKPSSSSTLYSDRIMSANDDKRSKPGIGSSSRRRIKREPQLIKNMGPTPPNKVQGEMTWNPEHHRWDGNDTSLHNFDQILSTSSRPALITSLQNQFPASRRLSNSSSPFLQNLSTSSSSSSGQLPNNVKIVGSMIFDPLRMSWFSMDTEAGEDELDLSLGGSESSERGSLMNEGLEEDEAMEDGWERGENARMLLSLQKRVSFVRSENGEMINEEEDELWRECCEAEKRHIEEMKGWASGGRQVVQREWLYDIRRLILDAQSES